MEKSDVKITIIGAGVVGLAVAYQLSKKYKGIYVVEKNQSFGEETSARSSEVVHSGIYYPANSLKTKLCIEGRELLYEFCDEFKINYNKCGKLIVAISKNDLIELDNIEKQAIKNGIKNINKLTIEEIKDLEPNINAIGALLVKDTGVVESYGYMKQLEINSKLNGVEIVYDSKIQKIRKKGDYYEVFVDENVNGQFSFTTEILINSAGLYADKVSNLLGIKNENYDLKYCKGEYFAVGNGKNKLVKRLIYPVPNENLTGLGVHVTLDVDNGLKLGPNAIYLENKVMDYSVNCHHKEDFYRAAKRFLPFLEKEDLYPAYSGIRPKLQNLGEPFRDFVILEEKDRGFDKYFNLIGIESPGLTASLAIGNYIVKLIE